MSPCFASSIKFVCFCSPTNTQFHQKKQHVFVSGGGGGCHKTRHSQGGAGIRELDGYIVLFMFLLFNVMCLSYVVEITPTYLLV